MLKTDPPTLLALRALGLGDFLTSLPALRALSKAFPHHRRVLAAPSSLTSLVELSDCGFELAHSPDLHSRLARIAPQVDVAVNLHGKGPESHRLLLQLQPADLIGFHNEEVPGTTGFPLWPLDTHEVTRWCRLLQDFSIPCDSSRLELKLPPKLRRSRPDVTVLHPGAASPARRWPAQRWATVARWESESGRYVIFTGSPDERDLCRSIAEHAGLPLSRVAAGDTGLVELAVLVGSAGRLACGDTGVAHLATALGTPSVVLFGPTAPSNWGPPTGNPIHQVLWKGSTGDPHASSPDPGLLDIQVKEVLQALQHLPAARRAPANA